MTGGGGPATLQLDEVCSPTAVHPGGEWLVGFGMALGDNGFGSTWQIHRICRQHARDQREPVPVNDRMNGGVHVITIE